MTFGRTLPTPEQRESEREARRALLCMPSRSLHRGTYAGTTTAADPKLIPLESEAYRRLVAAMPCKHCGIHGFSQAAHPNTGKGAGTKTDDRLCFPLCTVHPGAEGGLVGGCHERFDQGALFTKEARRMVEQAWVRDTQRAIEADGTWPANLPRIEA